MIRNARPRTSGDSAEQHRNWLDLIEISGPFLTLPVLRATWPVRLDPVEKEERARLRREHARWMSDAPGAQREWVAYVLGDMLGWGDDLHMDSAGSEHGGGTDPVGGAGSAPGEGSDPAGRAADAGGEPDGNDGQGSGDDAALAALALEVPEHDTRVVPSFVLTDPGEAVKPDTARMLGLLCAPGQRPTARVPGQSWAATPADRLAQLCRHHGVELGLATDGRWWTLVWAPRGGVTTTAVFDAAVWPERAERDVLNAFHSLLCRSRFFGVPEEERLPKLLAKSQDSQEDITEALGVQVRQAVELLVAAFGRADTELRSRGEPDLSDVDAHEVYRGAVSVMMRVVFLLFAEERGLLPSDNDLYAKAYSAGRLCAELERRALEGSEDELESTYTGWHRLLALFQAVYQGVDHPRLKMHAHDGSLFNPDEFPWLPLIIDDRTVLHMLRAVQYVEVGTGKSRERRALSFRALDVEQIGYVYEGLLSYDGFRASELVVGIVGKEGREAEVPLRRLEELAAESTDVPALAEAMAAEFKDSGIGSSRALEKKLAPLFGPEREEARSLLLAVTRRDYPLADRLLPFYQVLRKDLRGLPMVVLAGELYVTESALRKNTGTHYTPRFLAEEVVEGALEPLVYEPGPLQTADKNEWRLKSSAQILDLKVADIAMGSAAFLVAAARYLGGKLIEAWTAEDDPRVREHAGAGTGGTAQEGVGAGASASPDDDPLVIEARRQVIEHCLYGVDINPMAVEMAKLSLWLVSMDPQRPFTFLDDRLAAGDSLLGITSIEQLEYMHLDPKKGRELHAAEGTLIDFTAGVRELVSEVAETRRELAKIDGTSLDGLQRKREKLREAEEKTGQVQLLANLTVGAALANAGHGERALARGSLEAAELGQRMAEGNAAEAITRAFRWLDTDRPEGSFPRRPIHWPLVFPEVFEKGGFDAVIGNPPFLGGQKLTSALGTGYREYLVGMIGRGVRGSADLVAYFVLCAHTILNKDGQTGLIATNTLAQGDTRGVGLDQITAGGTMIRQAVPSKPWPSKGAMLEYCTVWTSRRGSSPKAERFLNGTPVNAITPSLEPASRISGNPYRLAVNRGISFQGSNILGLGFTLTHETAKKMIENDKRNKDVIFPYLNGQDLNSRPDCSAGRWVINFGDWDRRKAEAYADPYNQVVKLVKPERQEKSYSKFARENWWKYERVRPELYENISKLSRVISVAQTSKTVMPSFCPTGQVFSHMLVVFAMDDPALLAFLSSTLHYHWVERHAAKMKNDQRYIPSDCFETLPLPIFTQEMRQLGDRLDTYRRDVMLSRNSGLTKTYNMVFDPSVTDSDIQELRDIHRAIDEATVRAYGWEDRIEAVGGLDHGFHLVGGRETRYTIGPAAQREILDSLLELNHERYAEEESQGLHDKKNKKSKSKADDEGTLF
ncbi:hypothetical protein F4561_001924 [Lipingzhangella halophila]|uniref:site-specific DNA-methyltransferase (adenine-specific) n=1 Tax=Lipingzhangella halophila TaxID=1783352 RepID=A0A7W7RFN3_9ACTN|nr:type IIL restriction-modification enzyme MmeI [Lipingzhangella halophila]MBB4931104.1 hypothetical protein [Lipingzhangella halophila]